MNYYSLNKHLLSAYNVPGTPLGARGSALNKRNTSALKEFAFLQGRRAVNKINRQHVRRFVTSAKEKKRARKGYGRSGVRRVRWRWWGS